MSKRLKLHFSDCKTCSGYVRSLKKTDECEVCELKRLRVEVVALKLRAENAEAALKVVAEKQRDAIARTAEAYGWDAREVRSIRLVPLVTKEKHK